jgi:hypothetical protein
MGERGPAFLMAETAYAHPLDGRRHAGPFLSSSGVSSDSPSLRNSWAALGDLGNADPFLPLATAVRKVLS